MTPSSRQSPLRTFGDAAILCAVTDLCVGRTLASAVSNRLGESALEVVVGWDSVLVVLDSGRADPAAVMGLLAELAAHAERTRSAGRATGEPDHRSHALPVTFDGCDLDVVAQRLLRSPGELVSLLCRSELEVGFLGFAPGFAYLTGLPEPLAALPRRSSPRLAVPAGSVAVAGGFAAVYPHPTPGGWWLLGTTPVRLFDPLTPPYARLQPGDRVRFLDAGAGPPIGPGTERDPSATGSARRPLPDDRRGGLDVVAGGLLTLVEDAGRRRVAHLGVPSAGPADPDAMVLANRLAGNLDGAAVLELTGNGPQLRFGAAGHAVVVGTGPDTVEVEVDGRQVEDRRVLPVGAGQVLSVGRVRCGLRAYVAVSGGLLVPTAVGSRSADVLSGLGPAPLRAGDHLPLGDPGRPRGTLLLPSRSAPPGGPTTLRVLTGPHDTTPEVQRGLIETIWTVTAESNRVGIRLDGIGRLPPVDPISSTPMVTGAVQVPPDGRPIILGPDHATIGGYPVPATVITADLTLLGQLRPGDAVRLVTVDGADAALARHQRDRRLERAVSGWFPTTAGS
ncbi:MAG: 5-oxoprolinase subunit B/C family protein [Acidimicrobiales bacterium]